MQTQLYQSSSSISLGIFNYNVNNARFQLIKFIVLNELPLFFVENESF